MATRDWSRKQKDHTFSLKHEAEKVNWKRGKAVNSKSIHAKDVIPPPRLQLPKDP